MKLYHAIILGATVIMLAGCGGGASENATSGDAASTEASAPTSGITGDEEELEGALVSSFPDFAPLHPGNITKSKAVKRTTDGELQWSVRMETDSPFDDVKSAIATAYSQDGWEIVSVKEQNMGAMSNEIVMARGHGMTMSIVYTQVNDIVQISYGLN